MSSILDDTKHILGIPADVTAFDLDIMIHINSTFATLNQLGVGPVAGYFIKDKEDRWEDFTEDILLNAVKSYMFLAVKLIFDPPKTGFETAAVERQMAEMQFRLEVAAEAY
jgi:hypothetical protein